MKKLCAVGIILLMTSLCFAQVKSFDITDVDDWDDVEDNIILVNKTDCTIDVATLYGVKESDCPDGFSLSDFASKNEDGTYNISPKAEKIITFRGIKRGKSLKKAISDKYKTPMVKRFRYYILYVEEPEKFEFTINDLKEKKDDLYIYLKGSGVEKEYVYVEKTSSSSSSYYSEPSYSSSSSSTSKSSDATLKTGVYTCDGTDLKMDLSIIGTVTLKQGYNTLGFGTYKIQGNRLVITWTSMTTTDAAGLRGKTMTATILDDKSFDDGDLWVYTGW